MIVTVHHMNCDRRHCKAKFMPSAQRRWLESHVEEDAANAGWAVRSLNLPSRSADEHLCPRHAPEGTVTPRHRAAMEAALARTPHEETGVDS